MCGGAYFCRSPTATFYLTLVLPMLRSDNTRLEPLTEPVYRCKPYSNLYGPYICFQPPECIKVLFWLAEVYDHEPSRWWSCSGVFCCRSVWVCFIRFYYASNNPASEPGSQQARNLGPAAIGHCRMRAQFQGFPISFLSCERVSEARPMY